MDKFQKVLSLLKNYYKDKIKINYSPSSGYRSRCEFGYKNIECINLKARTKKYEGCLLINTNHVKFNNEN